MSNSFRPDARLLLRVRAEVRFIDPSADLVNRLWTHSSAGYLRIVDVGRRRSDGSVPTIACLLTGTGETELVREGLHVIADKLNARSAVR